MLIACKYPTVSERKNGKTTIELNPEGRHYHLRLSELERRRAACVNASGEAPQPLYHVQA